MSSEPATLGRQFCTLHADRHAVDRCASCGRLACLACAIPVRGVVLCVECARREVGEPTPPPHPSTLVHRAPDTAAAAMLSVGLLASFLPWDRFGTLTSLLSAWRLRPSWTLLAGASLLLATGAAVVAAARRLPQALRYTVVAYTAVGAVAAMAIVVALLRAPDFTSHTPAPYVALAGSLGGSLVGAIRLRRS